MVRPRGAGGTAAVNAATGAWSFTPSIALTDGTYTITVSQSDAAGNAATPATGTVLVDTPPTVTINQAVSQIDPVTSINTNAINFTVVFRESVTGFTASDVTFSGTAGGTKTVAITGSGATYNVAVTGMTSGTVIPSLTAAAASDATGNASAASSSTDHTVTYTAVTALSGTAYIDGNPGQGDQISGTATPGATITITESTPTSTNTYTGAADATGAFTIPVENIQGKQAGVTYSYSVAAQAPGYLAATPIAVSGVDNT